jgi:hypothetical protein
VSAVMTGIVQRVGELEQFGSSFKIEGRWNMLPQA